LISLESPLDGTLECLERRLQALGRRFDLAGIVHAGRPWLTQLLPPGVQNRLRRKTLRTEAKT
jgi:hypothetical protein